MSKQAEALRRQAARLRDEIKRLADSAAELEEEAKRYDQLPKDVWDNGTVIVFDHQFAGNPTCYTYAALKANGRWWLTGKATTSRTWEELLDFIGPDWMHTMRRPDHWWNLSTGQRVW